MPHYVRRCVHMVAAHEPRGSFPLDLIDCSMDGREEIVYRGVHSDVGGGYGPGEQGRGRDDADKLSQVPLLDMYREARKASAYCSNERARKRGRRSRTGRSTRNDAHRTRSPSASAHEYWELTWI